MSDKIKRYMNVSRTNLSDLDREVRDMILIGWEPLGGVRVVTRPQDRTRYVQTLVMRGEYEDHE